MGKFDQLFGAGNAAEENLGQRSAGFQPAIVNDPVDSRFEGTTRDSATKLIRVDRIIAKEQVRKDFGDGELQELAHSLRTVGQQQNLLVYWSAEDDRYVIISGERRWRAAQIAQIETLRCTIHPHRPDEAELTELQFVENAIRTDLNPIEEALSYKRLQDLKGYSANQLADRIGKNQTTISRSLKLLTLPVDIQERVRKGDIPTSVAREIVKLGDENEQRKLADSYLNGELTTATAQEATRSRSVNGSRTPSKNTKKWTEGGVVITVNYSRGLTLADVADALENRAAQLRSDGRSRKAA